MRGVRARARLARTCIRSEHPRDARARALVQNTRAPMVVHYCAISVTDKSVSLRLAAADTMMLCLKHVDPHHLEKEQRAKEIEATIRSAAVDASADVRKVGKKLFEAYKTLLPGRLSRYVLFESSMLCLSINTRYAQFLCSPYTEDTQILGYQGFRTHLTAPISTCIITIHPLHTQRHSSCHCCF